MNSHRATPSNPNSKRSLDAITALYRAGRSAEALASCQQLLLLEPERADALGLAGSLAMKLGDPVRAEAYYRAAIARDSRFMEAHFNLGNVLVRLGRPADAISEFRRAIELNPDLAAAQTALGGALHALGELGEAVQCFTHALRLEPKTAHFHRNLAVALLAAGEPARALDHFRQAVALRPNWPKGLQSLAGAAMEMGAWDQALDACRAWLKCSPANVEALGLASIALSELGESAAAQQLMDLDRMVQVLELRAPPPGFTTLSEFNAQLVRHALEHPSLHVAPIEEDARTKASRLAAIYNCPTLRVTGEYCSDSQPATRALRGWVASAVNQYLAHLARELPEHPFVAGAPKRFHLRSWAAILDGEGSLEAHAHYASHVSAVYYPQVPAEMHGDSNAGCFQFGGGPARYPCRVEPAVRSIRPRAGMLLLFPSYFYHRTAPFSASERRISIAFDAEPTADGALPAP